MAQSKIRKALGAVKDRTSIGLAKVSSSNSLCDLEVAIVKATRHDDDPAEEKYMSEIMSLTTYSRAYVSSCVATLSKRLDKTRNWVVALKTLILVHRLLAEGDPSYEQEIFFATRRGTRMLNMSDFRDTSKSNSWDFSAFVRTYALYLDERLEFRMHGRRNCRNIHAPAGSDEEDIRSTPVRDMRVEKVFARMQHLQQLLERFLACRPTGAAKCNRLIIAALYSMVKESFQIYYDIAEIMAILVERFTDLDVHDGVRVFELFSRASKQLDELDSFHNWCKSIGLARASDFPDIERITPKKLEIMDEYIRDKSASFRSKTNINNPDPVPQQEPEAENGGPTQEETVEPDMTSIKALPAPETSIEKVSEVEKETVSKVSNAEEQADLLNLTEEATTVEEQGDKLALALFAGDSAPPRAWEAFPTTDDTADWETALAESASNLAAKKAELGGGFDILMLDGMYEQAEMVGKSAGIATGSASSVAVPGYWALPAPGYLALPAPSVSTGGSDDPFAASLAVAPPAYVQMSDMEKKQRLLVEEQLTWQHYTRDGMQGQLGLANLQRQRRNQYGTGGYSGVIDAIFEV